MKHHDSPPFSNTIRSYEKEVGELKEALKSSTEENNMLRDKNDRLRNSNIELSEKVLLLEEEVKEKILLLEDKTHANCTLRIENDALFGKNKELFDENARLREKNDAPVSNAISDQLDKAMEQIRMDNEQIYELRCMLAEQKAISSHWREVATGRKKLDA